MGQPNATALTRLASIFPSAYLSELRSPPILVDLLGAGPVLAASCLPLVVLGLFTFAIQHLFGRQRTNIPIAIADEFATRKSRVDQYRFDSRNILKKGYRKFKNQIFGIDTSEGTNIVLPRHFMEELKSHPAFTFAATFDSLALPQFSRIKPLPPVALKVFTAKLNPTLGAFMPGMQSVYRETLAARIPESNEWTPVKIYPILFDMVCKSTARLLLGEYAAKNESWLELEETYIQTAIPYIQQLKRWPQWVRPFVYRRVGDYHLLNEHWAEGRKVMTEILRQKERNNWKPLNQPPSFFDHTAEMDHDMGVDDHLAVQITLFIAGVHTSAATTTHCVYDAAVNTGCLPELREEVRDLYKRTSGEFSRQNLAELKKLDSFIKEVQRFSSPDLTTFVRKSSTDVTLSNGFFIPKGSKIEVATGAICMDPEHFDDPETFNGLRFYRMRQSEGQASKHQLISVSKDDLAWGYGRHACPGRYMAEIAIKLMLAEVLLRYEIKNPEGKPRHPNFEFDGQTMPDESAEVLIRSVQH